jgi:error-prone DNA polymerase
MSLLRKQPPFNGCTPAAKLGSISSGRFVRIAGLVTGRQRPGTAKGTVFVTLEDETGNINVVVWSKVQENFRKELMTAKLLLIKGRVETEQSVTHVIAGSLQDCSGELETLALKSRDFH